MDEVNMNKLAFVFSGQGAQHPGMGKDIYDSSPAARRVFEEAESIRPGTIEQCFNGTEEELKITKNTQPLMFTVELASAAVLEEHGIKASMAAGFSLGEIAALTYSGAVDFKTGFELVIKRGEFMQEEADSHPSSMVAVLKLSKDKVEELAHEFSAVYPVNYNCPGQIACAGIADEMPAFCARVKESGGRAIPIKVAGGFHSPFMVRASERFLSELKAHDINPPRIPLYSNKTGGRYPDDRVLMEELLSKQICSPVLWENTVKSMTDEGCGIFIETGPGDTLSGLISKTVSAQVYSFGVEAQREKIFSEVSNAYRK